MGRVECASFSLGTNSIYAIGFICVFKSLEVLLNDRISNVSKESVFIVFSVEDGSGSK